MDPAPTTTSCVGRAPEFPAGLRVLLVDDDATCLKVIERMLLKCRYDVTTCSRAAEALSVLRERKGRFDLVLSDVRMPDMDGFKLLEHVGLEMDLPVIMMSADDHKDVVMKGVTHGAVDYLIKPVGMEPLKNIWQHVVRKKRFELKELEHSGSLEENDRQKRTLEEEENVTSGSGENWRTVKRKSEGKEDDDDEEGDEREDTSQTKKPRVVWSVELHQQFVTAVNQLGIDKAVPKKILELMKVAGLTRENVASHLQKYRLYLRRLSVPNHQGRIDGPFTSAQEALIPPIGAVDGFSFQALAVPGQFLPQSLTALPTSARRVENTGLSLPVFDQVGLLNTVNIQNSSRKKPESTQLVNNGGLNYLSGIPDSIQSRHAGPQYDHLHGNTGFKVEEDASIFVNPSSSQTTRSSLAGPSSNEQPSKSSIVHVLPQGHQFSLSRNQENFPSRQAFSIGQIPNNIRGFDSMLSSTIWQQMSPNVTPSIISGRNVNAFGTPLNMNNARVSSLSVPQSLYSNKQNSYVPASSASSYLLANSIGATNITGSADTSSNTSCLKGASDFLPSYHMISELDQNKTQDWKSQNVNLSYHSHLRQDSTANIKDRNISITSVRKEEIPVRTEIGHGNTDTITLCNSKILAGNSVAVKYESSLDAKYEDMFCDDSIISNELMSIVGKPQQQGVGEDESGLFEGYSLDNIQV